MPPDPAAGARQPGSVSPPRAIGPATGYAGGPAGGHGEPITIEQVGSEHAREWDGYVRPGHAGGSSYHLYAWRQVVEKAFGHPCHYWLARDPAGQVRGVLPVMQQRSRLFGNFAVSLPFVTGGGCLADDDRIRRALITTLCRRARELELEHVELRASGVPGTGRADDRAKPGPAEEAGADEGKGPGDPAHGPGNWLARTDKVAMQLDLPGSVDQLWRGFSTKLRTKVRRSMRGPVTVEFGGDNLLPEFYRVFARNMRDLGTPVYGRVLFREILQRLPDTHTAVVRLRGQAVAAGLLVGHGPRLEIPWASSLREHGRLGVNMLLYWRCLQFAVEQGYRVFDFGRSSPDSGTYHFKLQWGASARELGWQYWLPRPPERDQRQQMGFLNPDNPRFGLAIRTWRRLPLPVANVLGPHIVKYLP